MAQRNQPKQKSFTPAPSPALCPKSATGNHLAGDPFPYAADALSSDPLFWDGRDRDPSDLASYAPSTPESRAAFVAQLTEQRKTHPMMQGRFARQIAAENASERGAEEKREEGRSNSDYRQQKNGQQIAISPPPRKGEEIKSFQISLQRMQRDIEAGKIERGFLEKIRGTDSATSDALLDLTLMQMFDLNTLSEATDLRKRKSLRWDSGSRALTTNDVKNGYFYSHTPKRGFFREKFLIALRREALQRLQENQQLIAAEEAKYNPRSRPQTASSDLQRLRQIAQKDQQLLQVQRTQEQKLADTEGSIQALNLTAGSLQAARPEEVDRQFTQPLNQLTAQKETLSRQVAELKNVRTVLRTAYPALVGVNTETLTPETQDDKLRYDIAQKFNSIRGAIAQVRKKVQEDDGFLLELDDLVNAVKAKLTDQEGEREIVLAWLKEQNQAKVVTNILLAGTTISLGIGAFFTGGLLGIALGVAGAAVGLGTAAVQLKESSELYTVAEAGQVGKALGGDLEAAKFSYYLSWVNLVLAGLDLGLAAKAGTSILKGARATHRIANLPEAELLGQLQPGQVAQFDQAFQLRQSGKVQESEEILSQLKTQLGSENLQKLERIWAKASGVRTGERTTLAPITNVLVDEGKLDYIFGRATGRDHNIKRTQQNAAQMARLGIYDTSEGRNLVRNHLRDVPKEPNNIIKTFTNDYGTYEIRESLLSGPSGKFVKLESTWEITPDGSRRLTTVIPYGGPGKAEK
jgi:hypothetical protein